jgi:hypothetical protein
MTPEIIVIDKNNLLSNVLLLPLRPELDGQDVEAGDSKIWVFGGPFHLKRSLVVVK